MMQDYLISLTAQGTGHVAKGFKKDAEYIANNNSTNNNDGDDDIIQESGGIEVNANTTAFGDIWSAKAFGFATT